MSQLFLLVFKILYFLWFTGGRAEVKMEPLAPPPPQAAGLPRKAPVIVQMDADGSLSFEGQKLTHDALGKKLVARLVQEKDLALFIKADVGISVDRVMEVMVVCKKAGVQNIDLGVTPPASGGAPVAPQFEEERD